MNEIDLKLKIEGLEKVIKEQQESADQYKVQLTDTKKQLEDYNKPELTSIQLDAIQCAIESAIENYSFSDCDNYETDFSLDYDGRVQLESIDLSCSYELIEMIVDKVHSLFKEADCPEELDTTEPDNHKPVEKYEIN